MVERSHLDNGGVRLAYGDFGGHAPSILLLHGLAGYAGEWLGTAESLVPDYHVVALDARGHGGSGRRPDDVSPPAVVSDVVVAIERLRLPSVVLIGQSLGDLTALLVGRAASASGPRAGPRRRRAGRRGGRRR